MFSVDFVTSDRRLVEYLPINSKGKQMNQMSFPNVLPNVLKDSFGRAIRDLRISVTDRCNFRCFYCMPKEAMEWQPKAEILSYEEILQLTEVFVGLGVNKLRVTGGEPMVRRDLESLVERLAQIPGVADLAMTTNAHFLRGRADKLKAAGLQRITISLDSLTPDRISPPASAASPAFVRLLIATAPSDCTLTVVAAVFVEPGRNRSGTPTRFRLQFGTVRVMALAEPPTVAA